MNIFLEAAHLSPITVLCVEFRIPRKQQPEPLHSSKYVKKQESCLLAQSQAPRQTRGKLRVHMGKKEIHQQWYNVCGKCHKQMDRARTSCWAEGLPAATGWLKETAIQQLNHSSQWNPAPLNPERRISTVSILPSVPKLLIRYSWQPLVPWLHPGCRLLQRQSSWLSLHTRRLQANRRTAEPTDTEERRKGKIIYFISKNV